MTRRKTVGAALAAALAMLAIVWRAAATGGAGIARDGEGVLASANDPAAHESMAVDPSKWAGPWTFGVRLCLAGGSTPAVITSVAGATTVGSGFEVLGAKVRDWAPTNTDTPIISVDQFPETTGAVLHDAVGFSVTQPCPPPGAMAPRYTELDVGMARSSPDGGGWRGIDIGYTVNGSAAVVRLGHDLLICGPAVAADCGRPPVSSATPQ